jgi:XTP/dITP diphosphohydrolase
VSDAPDRDRILLATRNGGKLRELRPMFAAAGFVVRSLVDLALPELPEEEAIEQFATFEENALAKALEAVHHTGLPAVADDSGLAVDALNGMPGVLSARWAGRHGDERANLELLLGQVGDVPDERRQAGFVCAAAYALPDGRSEVVVGQLRGWLAREPRGTGGFGYDPLLVPDGLDVTTAELSAQEKDAISHRGKAFRQLAPRLLAALRS